MARARPTSFKRQCDEAVKPLSGTQIYLHSGDTPAGSTLVAMIIAIDGPSGSGKTTVSIRVAAALGFGYLDTGAIYRAIAANGGVDATFTISTSAAPAQMVVNGVDLSETIRTPEVTARVSSFAADPEVRQFATALIRSLIEGDFVVEGRDIGTVVAPESELKVYLTADEGARAARRAAEWQSDQDIATSSITSRDQIDSTRTSAPLRQADDAVVIDSTKLTVDEVVSQIVALAKERL